ncbi:MAG: FAD-linked oxidase C-terminal domain-containing protein [Planctomycetota bacterium]|nr:FAD-linked oxidase C-terminal domain-containing protein [Planctomycetota bacterium]
MGFENFLQALREIHSPQNVLIEKGPLAAFESDGLTAFAVRPKAVVFPESADEVVQTVRACHEHGIPFVARGSGTSLSGGSVPDEQGIIIALNRLNRILRVCPTERIAVVEPGIINIEVSHAVAEHGLYYAPDPSSQTVCTIGGNVAFNSGGAHCLKYGMTSNHVLGMKIVLANGEVVEVGSSSREGIGPDETGLFVGSEGLFGVAIEITLRLLPRPESFYTILAGYDSVDLAGDAVASIVASGLLPGAMEIMDSLSMEAARSGVGAEFPEGSEATLIVELDGSSDQVEVDREKLHRLIRDSGASAIREARDEQDRATIWKGRKSAFSAVGHLSPDFIVQDSVVPRTRLGEALRRIAKLSRESGIRVANVFHAGDGNLHPLVLYDGNQRGEFERAEQLAGDIVNVCIELGGSITGEHGVGMEKRQYLGKMFSPTDIDAMQRIRQQLDPGIIANREKMFPSDEAPALGLYGLHPLEKEGVISRE